MPRLTKTLKAGLLLLAGVLPEATCLKGERVSGQLLLDQQRLTSSDGKPIDAARTYRQLVPTGQVNHGKRLCRAYEQGGRRAVLAYCTPHIEPVHLAAFEAKLNELLPG